MSQTRIHDNLETGYREWWKDGKVIRSEQAILHTGNNSNAAWGKYPDVQRSAPACPLVYECPRCGMRAEKDAPCPECKVTLRDVSVPVPFICWVRDGEMESRDGKLICVPCDAEYRRLAKQLAELQGKP